MNTQLEELENAIHQRAKTLADTHLQTAQEQRDKILAESTKRLQQQENRETEIAKAAASQEYRRRVQASEIKMQTELDQLRWQLVQSVLTDLQEHFQQLSSQETTDLLKQYLKHAASLFDSNDLVAVVNEHDHALLAPKWDEIIKNIVLSSTTGNFTCGVLVHNQADRIRIDNTFEGLIARLENELYQIISAQLFASATPMRNI